MPDVTADMQNSQLMVFNQLTAVEAMQRCIRVCLTENHRLGSRQGWKKWQSSAKINAPPATVYKYTHTQYTYRSTYT